MDERRQIPRKTGVSVLAMAAALLAVAAPEEASAEESAPPQPSATQQSLISYPASFFAQMGLNTAYDMVQRVPGFVFDDGSAVRGFAGAVGNVLIDGGRPASKTDDLSSILRRLPVSSVERIDLIRGGAPGVDMMGKTEVVNVIRTKGSGFKGAATLQSFKPLSGVPFDGVVRLEGSWDDGGRLIEASLLALRGHDSSQGSGPHDIFGPGGQLLDSSRMQNSEPSWQYLGTAAYDAPALGGKLRVNLTLEDQPYHRINIDNFALAGRQVEVDRQDLGDIELGQHYERALGSDWQLEVIGLQHLNKTDTLSIFDTGSDHQVFEQNNHGGEGIGRGILHWRPGDALNVDVGAEFAYNWLNTRTKFNDNGAPIAIPAANVFVSEKRGEAFATAVWRPSTALAIESGLRTEVSTIASTGDVVLSKTLAFPKPRLIATWTPDASDQMHVRIEREVGQLDFNDFAANAALNANGVVAGNPNLSPQRDWAFEAAYDRRFWTDGVVSLTLRHLILQDVVDRVPVFSSSGIFDEPGNIGGGSENDVVVSFNLPLGRFGLDNAAVHGVSTWRFSEVRDPTTSSPREISVQHPLDAEIHFSQDFPRRNVTWGVDTYLQTIVRNFRFNEIDRIDTGTDNTLFIQYRPRPDLTLKFATDLEQVTTEPTRQVFAGPRNTSPLLFTDVQKRRFGPVFIFYLRKTFG